MKIKFGPTIMVLVIFVLITGLTYENNSAADGLSNLGFPFRFYTYNGGKFGDISLKTGAGFFPEYLAADLLVLIASIIAGNYIAEKWRQTK